MLSLTSAALSAIVAFLGTTSAAPLRPRQVGLNVAGANILGGGGSAPASGIDTGAGSNVVSAVAGVNVLGSNAGGTDPKKWQCHYDGAVSSIDISGLAASLCLKVRLACSPPLDRP